MLWLQTGAATWKTAGTSFKILKKNIAILSNNILCGYITTGDWYLYGIGYSDGFMDIYRLPNSSICIHEIYMAFWMLIMPHKSVFLKNLVFSICNWNYIFPSSLALNCSTDFDIFCFYVSLLNILLFSLWFFNSWIFRIMLFNFQVLRAIEFYIWF